MTTQVTGEGITRYKKAGVTMATGLSGSPATREKEGRENKASAIFDITQSNTFKQ